MYSASSPADFSVSCPTPTLAATALESLTIWRIPKSATNIQPAGIPVTVHRPTEGNWVATPDCAIASVKSPQSFHIAISILPLSRRVIAPVFIKAPPATAI
jgi:hypothetical protein